MSKTGQTRYKGWSCTLYTYICCST